MVIEIFQPPLLGRTHITSLHGMPVLSPRGPVRNVGGFRLSFPVFFKPPVSVRFSPRRPERRLPRRGGILPGLVNLVPATVAEVQQPRPVPHGLHALHAPQHRRRVLVIVLLLLSVLDEGFLKRCNHVIPDRGGGASRNRSNKRALS